MVVDRRARRDVLGKALLAGAVLVMGGVGACAAPAGGGRRARREGVTTFVFVAGAGGGASGDNELAMRGHRAVGVELPGQGPQDGQFRVAYQAPQDLQALAIEPSPMAGITLDDYVNRTVEVVRRVAEHGPVVLFGGSMGGATLSRVGNVVADLIDRLVYDSAMCCVDLPSPADYLATLEGRTSLGQNLAAGVVADPAMIGALRINYRSADPAFLAGVKAAVMAEGSQHEFMALLNSLLPDESLAISGADARGEKDTWGRIPRTYIRHTLDRMFPIALQDRMIAEADALTPDNRFDVRTVNTSHYPTTAAYREIVEILDSLAIQ
jgi:pimeloyl-ACP methyl ester carboxylesterase